MGFLVQWLENECNRDKRLKKKEDKLEAVDGDGNDRLKDIQEKNGVLLREILDKTEGAGPEDQAGSIAFATKQIEDLVLVVEKIQKDQDRLARRVQALAPDKKDKDKKDKDKDKDNGKNGKDRDTSADEQSPLVDKGKNKKGKK